ncbi:hypothetical protein AJ88_23310 [Mesorhizobium amorphae CCBAU 01583]|nr:hypothetical protein AJ88_23310 [Mesorhizobium amorphae CCBAU 01583]
MQPTPNIRAQCIADILVHHGQVEPFPIEISSTPPLGVGVFEVCLVRHDFQKALIPGDTANIFGRPGARSIDAGPGLGATSRATSSSIATVWDQLSPKS